jgi:integrase
MAAKVLFELEIASEPSALLPAGGEDRHPPAHLTRLADQARDYAKASTSANTQRAYASDWRHFESWCRRNLVDPRPDPQTVGLYITACADKSSVRTIERRLSAMTWRFAQLGAPLDRGDRHIATILGGIRRKHGRPPDQKEAVMPADLLAMLETVPLDDLRGFRDRAILLLGFAGGLRRSEIVGLDVERDQTDDGAGWVEFLDKGLLITLRGKTGWREVEIGRGSSDLTCPVVSLQTWLKFARITHGPIFRRVIDRGRHVGGDRMNDRHIARLVKSAALAAGVSARGNSPGTPCVPV